MPKPCDRGYYCPEGFWLPFECPAGTFNDQFHQESCFSCPAGYYCPTLGTVDPLECPADQVSAVGAPICEPCPLGHLCKNGLDVGFCPPGGYCKNGYYRACPAGTYNSVAAASDKSFCTPCPGGCYCRLESVFPRECPQGKYQPRTGATSVLACRICPTGFYCPKAGLVDPIKCPDGFICPPGTKSLGAVNTPCPPGSYCRGGWRRRLCPPGSYQDQKAQASCKTCPVGFWCEKGSIEPHPCSIGTFSNIQNITRPSSCEWVTCFKFYKILELSKAVT